MRSKEAVEDYILSRGMTVDNLVLQMERAWGFTSGKLAQGVRILQKMIQEPKCVRFLSFTGNIVATGTRGVLRELVRRKFFDVIVTACGSLDHDIARCWKDYYKGSFMMDDVKLHAENMNRLGNVLVPNESYGGIIEEKIQVLLETLWKEGTRKISPSQLSREIGRRICNQSSILYWATKNKVPVYVPGITDGAVGYQLWLFSQDHNLDLDLLNDSRELNEVVFSTEKTGALFIGGGISKHHTLWWNQFKGGLDYAVYISTAVEWDGSLSGARPREAISWGKINRKANKIMIEGDASIILPIMVGALVNRSGKS